MRLAPTGSYSLLPVGRTVLEGLGDVTLLEELCHWVWALKFQNSTPGPALFSAS